MDYLQYFENNGNRFEMVKVLNLIINGLPSILLNVNNIKNLAIVLNLIINGLPSILKWIKL